MKRFILFCLAAALCVSARPSLQVDRERIESGKTFGLQLVFPLNELPENRSDLQLEAANGFTLVGIDSTDQMIRPSMEDMFNSFFGGGNRGGYKARVYTFNLKAPKKTGRISIGQIFMNIDGQKRNLTRIAHPEQENGLRRRTVQRDARIPYLRTLRRRPPGNRHEHRRRLYRTPQRPFEHEVRTRRR